MTTCGEGTPDELEIHCIGGRRQATPAMEWAPVEVGGRGGVRTGDPSTRPVVRPTLSTYFDPEPGASAGYQSLSSGQVEPGNSVLSPKRLLERGFIVRHDEDVEEEPEQRAVDDEAPIAHQHRLTQDDGNDRDVYWITHITVETGHHEIPGRRDGRGGAETLQRETRKCVNEPRHA